MTARERPIIFSAPMVRAILGKVGELGARCAALEDFMLKVLRALPKHLLEETAA